MKNKPNFKDASRAGLEILYINLRLKNRKTVSKYCRDLLSLVDDWENRYKIASNCVRRSSFYGYKIVKEDLSEIDKMVFFWKRLADEIESDREDFHKYLTEKQHFYSEENFKRLYDLIASRRYSIVDATKRKEMDAETEAFSVIKNGEDW